MNWIYKGKLLLSSSSFHGLLTSKARSANDFYVSILNLISDWLQGEHFLPSQEVLQRMKTFCEDYTSDPKYQPGTLMTKLEGLKQEVCNLLRDPRPDLICQ
jgi:hypothetical protein